MKREVKNSLNPALFAGYYSFEITDVGVGAVWVLVGWNSIPFLFFIVSTTNFDNNGGTFVFGTLLKLTLISKGCFFFTLVVSSSPPSFLGHWLSLNFEAFS